jgi:tetratricopeptide (TPR) repeat protein
VVTKKDKTLAAAQKFLERGQLDKALAEFAKVVQEDPKDTRTWLKMAELHAKRGAADQATEIYLKTGELYTEQGFFQKAVAVYKNVLKLSPSYVQGHFKLAEVFKRLGLITDAVQQFELGAFAYQKAGRPTEALGALRAIVELTPDNVVSRIKLAEAASQAGATEEAIQEFARAADQLKLQGRFDEYVRVAERLLFHQPDNLAVARELAEAYIDKNNARLALAKLQVCLKAEPRGPENVSLLARAFEQLDVPKAVSVLKELIEIHQELGHTAERDVAIRRAMSLDPRDVELQETARHYGINVGVGLTPPPIPHGQSLRPPIPGGSRPFVPPASQGSSSSSNHGHGHGHGHPGGAIEIGFGAGVRPPVPPRSGQDISRIIAESDVFVKYGLLDRAVDHLKRAFEIQPDFLPAREKLAAVLTQLGRRAEAAAELQFMAERLASTDRAQAMKLDERARVLDPGVHRPLALLEGTGLGLEPSQGGFTAGTSTGISSVTVASPMRRAPPRPPVDDIDIADSDDDARAAELTAELGGDELELDLDLEDALESGDDTGLDLVTPAPRLINDPMAAADALGSSDDAEPGDAEVTAELEQVDFFLDQSLPDEALAMLADLQMRYPGNETIARRMVEVERFANGDSDVPPTTMLQSDPFGSIESRRRDERAGMPLRSLDPEPIEHAPVAVVAGGEKADLSTHGDLGIAYKEMGLLDAAIGEFKLLTQDPGREVFALTMIGECCEAKGSLTDAIIRYKEALNCPQVTQEESVQLYYCLGLTFEKLSDRSEALYFYEKVGKRDPKFRDVSEKLATLRPRTARQA